MAHHLPTIACHALLLASASALAQNNTVLITSPASQQVSGFENLSLREAPFSATLNNLHQYHISIRHRCQEI